jgi:U3 small nucleolar RNA-associated protein 22
VTASPTPFYNASLRSNCNYENYLKLLYSSGKQSSSFKDACILGRIWLRQRGFGSSLSCGGFGHFEWTALTALLMKGGASKGHSVLSPGYSSYQMFKAVLQFLALSNLVDKPLILGSTNIVVAKSNTPMLYDCERDQNVLYKMTPWSWSMLQEEAKISLSMLNNSILDPFESLFIARSNQPLQRFDCLFQVAECPDTIKTATLDYSPRTRSFSNRLYQVLRDGLTDRVKLINIEEPGILPWSVKSAGPSETNTRLLISIVFDPANIDRLVDHGPPAEEKKKAAKFQKFWGDKAELRRFKDGSILESLIWSTGSSYDVVNEILSHLLKRHFAIESGIDTLIGEAYGKLLPGSGTGTKGFEGLNEEFKTLETAIRNLDGLPLQLRQFSAISPQLRYSSMDIPSFSPRRPLKEPADVLLQFEGSGRWPDDVVAIQRTKIAFLLKVGNLLQEVNETITTRVGLENEDHPLQNCAFLDIVFESGAALRLRIHNDREQTLLERQVKDKSIDQHSREEAVSALSVFKRTFLQLPLLTQSIATHCTRFPLLSPTIRLVKMWFDRHMLIPHVNEELIELLVSHTFLHPHPWTAPSSVMTGFLRTIHFISKWDWRTSPLIVDFTGTMTSKEVEAVTTRLEAWRKIDPGMVRTVLFAASNHDLTGTVFTSNGPSKLVAARMTALARSATKLVKEKALDLDHRTLFAASTTDYDFVVHLSSKFTENSMRKGSGQSKFKNLEVQSESKLDLIGYQPVRKYVQELEEIYSNSVIFFHSTMAGSVIGGLWNPHAAAARPFKVNSAYATKIVETMDKDVEAAGEVIIDKSAILAEIARLGGDMVSRVEANR